MPLGLVHREARRGIFDADLGAEEVHDVGAGVAQRPAVLALLTRAVEDNPLFETLSTDERQRLLDSMTSLNVPERTVLIHQGDPKADTFYILTSGTCSASVNGHPVKQYQAGGSFGELSLLFSKPRAAMVTCTSDCELMVMRRSIYNAVRADNCKGIENTYALLLKRPRGLAVLSETTRSELSRGLKEMTLPQGAALPRACDGITWVLAGCAVNADGAQVAPPSHYGSFTRSHKDAQLHAVTDMTCVTLSRTVVQKLLGPAEHLQLFDSLRVLPMLYPLTTPQLFELARALRRQPIHTVSDGARFGAELVLNEEGLLYRQSERVLPGCCVTGTVRAVETCRVRTLDAASVDRMTGLKAAGREWRLRAVKALPELANLDNKQLRAVGESLQEHRLPSGTEIVKVGEEVPGYFIIQSGVCRLGKLELSGGTHFGGWAMMGKKADEALVAVTDVVVLPVEAGAAGTLKYTIPRFEDLQSMHEIGAGTYGHVMMVACQGGRVFAMKRLDKVQIKAEHMSAHVKRERLLHSQCCSEFVTRLWGSYNKGRYLYLLMECVRGGDLYTHMKTVGSMTEATARFYVACIVCGLDHLHSRHIAWRDLKPENLLLDENGYLKVTDLGFACTLRLGQRRRTMCGTTEYIAPEVVLKLGHNMAVDWWALGVLIYELVAGYTPFVNRDGQLGSSMHVYRKICRVEYTVPRHFSPPLVDLVERLLEYDPARRLCSGIAGAIEIKEHPWFAGFDWGTLQARTMRAPFIPLKPAAVPVANLPTILQERPARYTSAGEFAAF